MQMVFPDMRHSLERQRRTGDYVVLRLSSSWMRSVELAAPKLDVPAALIAVTTAISLTSTGTVTR